MKIPKDVQECFPWVIDIEGLTEKDIVRLMSTATYQGYIVGKKWIEFKAVVAYELKRIFSAA